MRALLLAVLLPVGASALDGGVSAPPSTQPGDAGTGTPAAAGPIKVPSLPGRGEPSHETLQKLGAPFSFTAPSATISGRLAFRGQRLLVTAAVVDDRVTDLDALSLTLHSVDKTRLTLQERTLKVTRQGTSLTTEGGARPVETRELLGSTGTRDSTGFTFRKWLPADALPPLPPRGPALFELCLTYEDLDVLGRTSTSASNCPEGALRFELPPEIRKDWPRTVPAEVTSVERRPGGWVGHGPPTLPFWVATQEKNQGFLRLIGEGARDPKEARITLSPTPLRIPDRRVLMPVVVGEDPFGADGGCQKEKSLLFALYLPTGQTALRVLEWPIATCTLGRASAIELDEDGSLTIGFSSGAVVSFVWSRDHFERTEIGKR